METHMETKEVKPIVVKPARAAVLLDISRSKIYEAIAAGQIPACRVAGQLRVPLEALKNLVAEQLRKDEEQVSD
jgi:excisionase family DNA binding protein